MTEIEDDCTIEENSNDSSEFDEWDYESDLSSGTGYDSLDSETASANNKQSDEERNQTDVNSHNDIKLNRHDKKEVEQQTMKQLGCEAKHQSIKSREILQHELNKNTEEKNSLIHQNQYYQKQHDEDQEEIKNLKQQITTIREKNKEKIEVIKNAQKSYEIIMKKASDTLESAKRQSMKDLQVIKKLKKEINKLHVKNNQFKTEAEEAIIKNVRLTRNISKMEEVMNDDHEDEQKQKKMNIKLMADISNIKTHNIELQKELYILEDKYNELKQKYNQDVSKEKSQEKVSDNISSLRRKVLENKKVRFKE